MSLTQLTRKILGKFGLTLPDHNTDEGDSAWPELWFDSSTLIIWPLASAKSPGQYRRNEPTSEVEFCCHEDAQEEQNAVEIHSSTFALPKNAPRRFARAVASLNLEVVSPTEKCVLSSLEETSRQHLQQHEPRWMLFCDGWDCH